MADILSNIIAVITGQQAAKHYLYVTLPIAGEVAYLVPDNSYYTITLNEMFLQDNQMWWQEWFPAIQFQLKASFNETDITLTTVNQPPLGQSNQAVDLNHVIVDLMPYGGETVEITLALTALQGQNYLNDVISVLGDFSGLITPPIEQALNVVETLGTSIQKLLNTSQANVHLGFHQSFVPYSGVQLDNTLKPGFYAVILATEEDITTSNLSVANNRLRYNGQPFIGFDYFLFSITSSPTRIGWRNLPTIDKPMKNTLDAITERDANKIEAYTIAAQLAVQDSPDLTRTERQTCLKSIMDELQKAKDLLLGGAISTVTTHDVSTIHTPTATEAHARLGSSPLTGSIEPQQSHYTNILANAASLAQDFQ